MAVPQECLILFEEGIDQVCFNVEDPRATMSRDPRRIGVEAAYYRFLSEIWAVAPTPGKISFIREIEHAIQQDPRPAHVPFTNQLVEPFTITSMDGRQHLDFFARNCSGRRTRLLKIFCWATSIATPSSICRGERISPGCLPTSGRVSRCCRESCEYFSVLRRREPVNKLAENGSFASTETTYCRLTKMQATDLVLDALERLPLKKTRREAVSRAEVCK